MSQTIYDFTINRINGKATALKEFQGKVLLIVNVASKCGLTSQSEGLEKIYEKYQQQGLVVLGIPANEFLSQEPGSNEDIQQFCTMNYGVKFPMFEKIVVKGPGQHPFYTFLINKKPEAVMKPGGTLLERLGSKGLLTGEAKDIKWNFEKFLVDKQGIIVERFSPELDPQDPLIVSAIEKALR